MGNVSGYVKVKDNEDSSKHLIKVNQLCNDRNWRDVLVYDFQNNEIGKIENGKYEKASAVQISGVGECYIYNRNGMIELYPKKWFREHLKNAAVEHINNTFKRKDDEESINLKFSFHFVHSLLLLQFFENHIHAHLSNFYHQVIDLFLLNVLMNLLYLLL